MVAYMMEDARVVLSLMTVAARFDFSLGFYTLPLLASIPKQQLWHPWQPRLSLLTALKSLSEPCV
jgi:hypothetical protein